MGAVGAAARSLHSLSDGFRLGAGFALAPTPLVFIMIGVGEPLAEVHGSHRRRGRARPWWERR
jgi:hypothetical protein